jgi:ribosome assembly protein RRB1
VQEVETTFDVNRLRSLNNSPIVAYWNDDGHRGEIRILDLTGNLEKLNNNIASKRREKGKEIVIPCESSGFAINWNPHKVGELAAGDNRGIVSLYTNNENYTKWSRTAEYSYHHGSVEDIAFSPEQSFVFASCNQQLTQAHPTALCRSWTRVRTATRRRR